MSTSSRRLLATLSSIPSGSASSSSSGPAGPFIPPYTHSTAAPSVGSPSLRPPYAHALPSSSGSSSSSANQRQAGSSQGQGRAKSRINAPYRYLIPTPLSPSQSQAQTAGSRAARWESWARSQLSDDARREQVLRAWKKALVGLQEAQEGDHPHVPEIAYSALSDTLADARHVDLIRTVGSVVIRDVVPDKTALGWARDVRIAMEGRGGDAVYWHPALVAARSNLSVLNTTSSVLAAITRSDTGPDAASEGLAVYVVAESVREGLGSGLLGHGRYLTGNPEDVWAIDEDSSALSSPSTPLLAHLALTPAPSPASTFALLSGRNTIHTATYNLLRPLFRPVRSSISFSSAAGYLDASNWALYDPTDVLSQSSDADMPHLRALASLPPRLGTTLEPGDMVLRHPHLTVPSAASAEEAEQEQAQAQAFLPLAPLPVSSEANRTYVQVQRQAYEQGLPPPIASNPEAEAEVAAAVRVEETFSIEGVQGRRGKKAMGY